VSSKINLWLFILTLSLDTIASIGPRFVPAASSSTLNGSWSLWTNPSGLAFLEATQADASYLYEFSQSGPLHHGTLHVATNIFDSLSLAAGIQSQYQKNKTQMSGIFAGALKITNSSSLGISFMKSYDFLKAESSSFMISFGLQSRINKYLAIGALYQEVNNGYFKAPLLEAGFGLRPRGDIITLGIDARATPLGLLWSDGFRCDPIFSLKAHYAGFAFALGAQIPDIKQGWLKPIFSSSLEFNFAHWGFALNSLINTTASNYAIGSSVRASKAQWISLQRDQDYWVELSIDSDGTLEERRSNLSHFFSDPYHSLSTLAFLKRLKSDREITGVIIHIKGFSFGDGRIQEWRNALLALKEAHKEIIVYLDNPSERDYYVATAAHKIFMNKQSTLSLGRFQKTLVYFADLLAKIGLQAEAIVAGKYKTAPRNFTNSRPHKEEIEIYANILTDFYENFLRQTSHARNISEENLRKIFNQGEITALKAQQLGLIDQALYEDQIKDILQVSTKTKKLFSKRKKYSWDSPKKISVITIEGEITDGRVYPTLLPIFGAKTGALDVIDEIENALNDQSVIGIIIRINSPGGTALAGAKIQRALALASKHKPTITSMADVAASAGYLVATGTNYIISERNTITGSIGVFSLYFSAEKLAKKLGINSHELFVIEDPQPTYFQKLTPQQKLEAQKIVDWAYQNFISAVATGLNLSEDDIKKSADGRVWLGHEAFNRKLVQEIGGFAQAIDKIREYYELSESENLVIQIHKPGIKEIFSLSSPLMSFFRSKNALSEVAQLGKLVRPYIKAIDAYSLHGVPQARLPFNLVWE
jgi:protease-4